MNKSQKAVCLTAAAFLFVAVLFQLFSNFFSIWNLQVYDQLIRFRYQLFGNRPASPYVIQVNIDDQSLRDDSFNDNMSNICARTIEVLSQAGVSGIAVDIFFPPIREKSYYSPLIQAVKESGNVYFPVILRPKLKDLSLENEDQTIRPGTTIRGVHIINAPKSEIEAAARIDSQLAVSCRGVGHITCYPDHDGIYRRTPLVYLRDQEVFFSLSLRMMIDYFQLEPEQISIHFGKQIQLADCRFPDGRVKDIRIPIDRKGNMIIHFTGPWKDSFAHYPVEKILGLNSTEIYGLRDEIEGSLVVFSNVSTMGRDIGAVPLENYYPLSGIHANVISSVLKQNFMVQWPLFYFLLLNIVLGALAFIGARYFQGWGFALWSLSTLLLFAVFMVSLFIFGNIISNLITPGLSLIISMIAITVSKYIDEEKEKTAIRSRVENYFAPILLEKILKSPDLLKSREKKQLTILFSDIVGFTSWCENKSAEEIHQVLNEYFDAMARIVFKYEGTIDKYIGDGLLVFFGDPACLENHAENAVMAGIEMQKEAARLRARWADTHQMDLKIRIGINTGQVVVGNMGSEKRMDYTVIGSQVNLAQRLESSATPGRIMISEPVYELVKTKIEVQGTKKIRVKGIQREILVYEI